MERLRRNWEISLILLLFIILALAYSIVNPLHEATDELRHYRFVRYLVTTHELPVQGEEACRSQSHHPPLFYLMGALATSWIDTGQDVCHNPPSNRFWAYRYADVGVDNKNMYLHGPDEAFPWSGEALAAHIIRALNVLIGAGTVWLTWAIGRAIWPERRALAAGGTAFVAFNPMFLYMSGAINNDIIAAFSGAAVLLACVLLLRDPGGLSRRWGLIFGALYGLALMSKFNMAAVALLVALAVTYVAWKRGQWRLWFEVALLSVAVAALIAGWWFVRNQILYGEPTGLRVLTELWGVRDPSESLPLAILELPSAWTTLWGRFGFGQIPLPDVIYRGIAWLMFIGLLGLLLPLLRRRFTTPPIMLALLAANVVLAFAVLFNYMLVSPAGAMGRFFFPGLPALALLTFYGLDRVVQALAWLGSQLPFAIGKQATNESRSRQLTSLLALGLNAALVGLSLVALFGYLRPAYARPPAFSAEQPVPNPVDASFEGLATLRGYELSSREVRPGEFLEVKLYWEVNAELPGNYLLFVHLFDEAGTLVTQRDSHPGTGNFPTGLWQAGDRFVDSIQLYVPETAYTPTTAELSLGLYAPTYRLGISGPNGAGWGDALSLGTIRLEPATHLYPQAEAYPNPLDQNFNNDVQLLGYRYDERVLAPGEELTVTLYWQALQQTLPDYQVQVHLLDDAGTVLSSDDRAPRGGWLQEEIFADEHALRLPESLEPGSYRVEVALVDPDSQTRLNVVADDGHWLYDQLRLARIRVAR